MATSHFTTPRPASSGKPSLLHSVIARFAAIGLWKIILALVLIGGSAAAFHHYRVTVATRGVVLDKLVALNHFDAEQGTYQLNFVYVVHKSHLGLTGESIQVIGSGTDEAYVNMASINDRTIVDQGTATALIVLPRPQLDTPVVDTSKTTLKEKRNLLTRIADAFKSDPNGAREALVAAQGKLLVSAEHSPLRGEAETTTRNFLIKLLGHLGYTHVTVTFF